MVAFGWTVAALAASVAVVRADVDPIIIKGSKFFYKTNGTQFYIRGVAYQQDAGAQGQATSKNAPDPLADSAGCKRDIPFLKQLRTNAVRVYSIDPTANHDACMNALADAGIYVLADLSSPSESIISTEPSWDVDLYNRYSSVIDTMAKYTNTLGFFAGNEVIFNSTVSDSAPFVKAAVRDMKAYIKQKQYRPMGVGYAADDDQFIRAPMENYLNCGSDDDGIDFFGYNVYSWCGQSDIVSSHYLDRTKEFANYSVPVFFAEYGCNTEGPRTFQESGALFGSQMNGVWSGGFVFEYFQAPNKFGLVTLQGSSVSTLSDFKALSTRMASINPTGTKAGSYNPTNTRLRSCPDQTPVTSSVGWLAATALPPTPNQELCTCMVRNLTCNAKANIKAAAVGQLFTFSCPEAGACNGINADGSKGMYGAYSMCAPAYRLAWSFNNYYFQNPGSNDACDFSGNATKQSPNVAGDCSDLLKQAGAAGTGHVTSVPTGHQGSGSGGSGSAASSSSAAVAVMVPAFDLRFLTFGAYLTLAAVAGAGMILL